MGKLLNKTYSRSSNNIALAAIVISTAVIVTFMSRAPRSGSPGRTERATGAAAEPMQWRSAMTKTIAMSGQRTYCRSYPRRDFKTVHDMRAKLVDLWRKHNKGGLSDWRRSPGASGKRLSSSPDANYGGLEKNETWVNLKRFFPGTRINFFDIGCNRGHVSEQVLGVWKQASCYCLEAVPATAKMAAALLTKYNHSGAYIEVHGNPVSDKEEVVKIYAAAGKGEAGSEWTSLGKGGAGNKVIASVQSVTLDNFVRQHQPPIDHIDLLKIDAEGFEGQVFRGAVWTLTNLRPPIVHFECGNIWFEDHWPQYSLRRVNSFFEEHGYDIFYVAATTLHPVSGPFYEPMYDGRWLSWRNCMALSSTWKDRDNFIRAHDQEMHGAAIPFLLKPCHE